MQKVKYNTAILFLSLYPRFCGFGDSLGMRLAVFRKGILQHTLVLEMCA